MIEIKNLTKTYSDGGGKSVVVNDISLRIHKGEFVSIVGQSGSGKSKLLHLLGGLDTPTSGEIIIFGNNITNFKDKDKSKYRRDTIGFIFQDFILEGEKTVLDNVMMPMVFAGVSYEDRKKVAIECLKKVNMIDKSKCKVNTLSGGQKQRVAIARALVNTPQILLADEPTGNLDSKNGNEIMQLLKELNRKGYTIIMVTHNNEQALESDKIVKIKDGKVIDVKTNKEKNSSTPLRIEVIEENIIKEGE